jgi:hypothetical protein
MNSHSYKPHLSNNFEWKNERKIKLFRLTNNKIIKQPSSSQALSPINHRKLI